MQGVKAVLLRQWRLCCCWRCPRINLGFLRMQGVKLVFYDSVADVLLLEVPEVIPDKFNVYRLGYDASTAAVPERAVCIHHPNGNVKRISYANATCADTVTALVF